MRVAIVIPPVSFEERYEKGIAKAVGNLPPLGILYIAAVVREGGHKVLILDGSMYDMNYISKELLKFKPDLIGINVMTFLWEKVQKWSKHLKGDFPNVYIIVGGPHATIMKGMLLEECSYIDGVITGEAEYLMRNLATNLENNKSLNEIKGLIWRKDGKIISNEENTRISDLDALPFPARDLIPLDKYIPAPEQYKRLPVTNVMTTRGCPYQCTFCNSRLTAPKYRSPENVVKELTHLVNDFGIKEIAFWDDTFTLNKNRVLNLCEKIKESNLNIIWSAHSRSNLIDEELAQAMKSAGCWKIFFGFESMMQKNLDTLKKGLKVEDHFNAIKICKKYHIESECSFIFGIPNETYNDAIETIDLIKKLDPDYMKCFSLTPMPGTELWDKADEYGELNRDLTKFSIGRAVFVPKSMTREEVESLVSLAYRRFYLRPRYIFNYIRKIRSFVDIQRAFRGFRALMSL